MNTFASTLKFSAKIRLPGGTLAKKNNEFILHKTIAETLPQKTPNHMCMVGGQRCEDGPIGQPVFLSFFLTPIHSAVTSKVSTHVR